MSSENYELSAAQRFIIEENEIAFNRRVAGVEEYPVTAAVLAGRPLPLGPTLNSAGNLSVGSLYQDVGGGLTDAFGAITGVLINGSAGVVAGVADIIGGIADIPNQIFGKFVQQPSSPKYGMSERGTTTQGAGTSTSAKQDIAAATAGPVKLSYPLNQSSRFKFVISISKYVKPDPLSRPQKVTTADIVLPIPANLVDKFSVDLQEKELGQLTSQVTTAISDLASSTSGASGLAKLEKGASFLKNNAEGILKDAVTSLALNAVKTAGQGRGIDAEALVSTTLGVAINPGAAVMFKGVRLRPDHSFQWKLTPRNSGEAEAIKGIIGKLRRNMLPSTESGSLGMVFNYPQIFNIAILPEDNPFFPKFKSCFLESMEVNYAPSGPSFHGDNVPTEIDLKLTFQELVIFTADDFDDAGNYKSPGMAAAPAVATSTAALAPVPPGGFGDNSVTQQRAKVEADIGRQDRDPRGALTLAPTDPRLKLGIVQLPAFVDPRRPNRP
jgi:hypothetical protein